MRSFLGQLEQTKEPRFTSSLFTQLTSVSDYPSLVQKTINNLNIFADQLTLLNESSSKKPVRNLLSNILTNSTSTITNPANYKPNTYFSFIPTSSLNKSLFTTIFNHKLAAPKLLLKCENANILSTDQITRNYDDLLLGGSNYNFSTNSNAISSTLNNTRQSTVSQNTPISTNLPLYFTLDYQFFTKLVSRQLEFGYPHPTIHSNNYLTSSLNYDTNIDVLRFSNISKNSVKFDILKKPTYVNPVVLGDQANAVSNLNTAY